MDLAKLEWQQNAHPENTHTQTHTYTHKDGERRMYPPKNKTKQKNDNNIVASS